MLILDDTVVYSRTEVRGGESNTELNHLRASRELESAITRDFMQADPARIYASLRNLHRSRRPYRSRLARETLPLPDNRSAFELAAELRKCYGDRRASHAVVLQMAANRS